MLSEAMLGLSSAKILADTSAMLQLLRDVCQDDPIKGLTDSEEDRLRWIGAAERALEVGDNPGKLFTFIVSRKKWGLLNKHQLARARERIRRANDEGDEPCQNQSGCGLPFHVERVAEPARWM